MWRGRFLNSTGMAAAREAWGRVEVHEAVSEHPAQRRNLTNAY